MTDTSFKKGDHVSWNTSQGQTRGTVERKVAGKARVKGHTAVASEASPQYKVRSDKSGATAIHKPESLKKLKH